jgi:plastocyanin
MENQTQVLLNSNYFVLKRISILLGLSVIFSTIIFGTVQVHAEEYEVIIPQGAYSPQCVKADTCFVPTSLQIPEDSIVEWKNKDSAPHTIVSSDNSNSFSSRVLNYNDEFNVDFSSLGSGVYSYYCSIHPWMKGEIIVGMSSVSSQTPTTESTEELDEDYSLETRDDSSKQQMKMDHKTKLLSSQRILDNYTLRLDWIREFPVTNEVNGFELIVTDSSKATMIMSDGGMGGGCGGGHEDDHGDTSSHDGKGMKGKMGEHGDDTSSHDSTGMAGGMEGGCPHFKMVKKSIPKVAALEAGVENLENSLKMKIVVLGKSYPVSLHEDNNFKGRYYVLFIPTIAAQYDVHVSGMIDNKAIDVSFSPPKVIEKSLIQQIP